MRGLAGEMALAFPALAGKLAARAEFAPAVREQDGRVVAHDPSPYPLPEGARGNNGTPLPEGARGSNGTFRPVGLSPSLPGSMEIFFPAWADQAIVVRVGGLEVVAQPLGARPVRARVVDGKLAYAGAFPHTDILHTCRADGTEEFMLLAGPEAPRRFEYLMRSNARAISLEAGAVRFSLSDGAAVRIEAPYVVDARGVRSDAAARWELLELDQDNAACRLALVLDPAGLTYPLVIDPSFTAVGSMTEKRQGHNAVLAQNGKVYVMLGKDAGTPATKTEVYDPRTGSFAQATPPPAEARRHGAASVLLRSGRILLVGGLDAGSNAAPRTDVFDPNLCEWTSTGNLDAARAGHTCTRLKDGRVLAAGGYNASGHLKTCEIYDPAAGTWSYTGVLGTARARHAATLLSDGRVLVSGGENAAQTGLDSAEIYDPVPGTWSPTGTMCAPRAGHSSVLLPSGKVLVAFGSNDVSGPLSSAELYDPGSNAWGGTGSGSTPRWGHTATILPNGKVLAVGGLSAGSPGLDSAEIYDPNPGTWAVTASLGQGRYDHTATNLPTGQVAVIGGQHDVLGALAGAEVYDYAQASWSGGPIVPEPRAQHTTTVLADLKVLAAGGYYFDGLDHYLGTAFLFDPVLGVWQPTGAMWQGRRDHTATLLLSDQVLVAGGGGAGGIPLATAETYQPATGSFLPTGPMLEARVKHTATALPNSLVLIAGGGGAGGIPLKTTELYDYVARSFAPGPPMAQERFRHTATLLMNGKVLVTGGLGAGGTPRADAELYDFSTGQWTGTGSMAGARHSHTATLLPSGKVLVAGGGGGGGGGLASCELYDPTTGAWTGGGTLSTPRVDHSATLLTTGEVLVAGGATGPGAVACEVYDPAKNTWAPAGTMSLPRAQHGAALLPNGKVLVAFGSAGPGIYLNGAEFCDRGLWSGALPPAIITSVNSPVLEDQQLNVIGSGFSQFQGSGGNGHQDSAVDYPLILGMSLRNEALHVFPCDTELGGGWSGTHFTSVELHFLPQYEDGIGGEQSRYRWQEVGPGQYRIWYDDYELINSEKACFLAGMSGEVVEYPGVYFDEPTPVTISGSNFSGTGTGSTEQMGPTTVTFGGLPASNVQILSTTQIKCVTPVHPPGVVDVVIADGYGRVCTMPDAFEFLDVPTVLGVTPPSGRMGGGTSVTVTGTNFALTVPVQVDFGGALATNVVVRSHTQLTCSTPPHAAGPVNVTVTNPMTAGGTLPNGYTYIGWEGDVGPRAALGDEDLLAGDLMQLRRFAAGLDTPQAGAEFQRADIAPRLTLGDGDIQAGDLSQQRRYVAGLDPLTNAGGPTAFSGLSPWKRM